MSECETCFGSGIVADLFGENETNMKCDDCAKGIALHVGDYKRLMKNYPSDGWDGAAVLISQHHNRVLKLAAHLDKISPGWREEYHAHST